MRNLFSVPHFEFPYQYKFPGQASDESILFVLRENPIMLWLRRVGVVVASLAVLVVGWWLGGILSTMAGESIGSLVKLISLLVATVFGIVGWWWISSLWLKSLFILTTKRLTKFVYTTPFSRYNLSLPLDQIVDTGSYTKGMIQSLFGLGTLTARSSASSSGVATDEESSGEGRRVNKKYFYIENIVRAEDLQQYINKLLYANKHAHHKLSTFRPFISELKGESRKEFMKQFPEYWS